MKLGELMPYTCPEYHGVLSALKDGERVRFRCHTRHAFSADALLAALLKKSKTVCGARFAALRKA
ncbi:MAG: hypothetical protein ABI954_06715 [Pyrinomonadaceae bacterium]